VPVRGASRSRAAADARNRGNSSTNAGISLVSSLLVTVPTVC